MPPMTESHGKDVAANASFAARKYEESRQKSHPATFKQPTVSSVSFPGAIFFRRFSRPERLT